MVKRHSLIGEKNDEEMTVLIILRDNRSNTRDVSPTVQKCGKFASFTIKERQSLLAVNHYLIIFNANAVFLDWKDGA